MTQDGRGIGEHLRGGDPSFSFEFFPPKDEAGEQQLWRAIGELEPYAPTFVSVTYGAGGTNRDSMIALTGRIARDTALLPMAHLTCVGHTRSELAAILDAHEAAGVHNLLALRGDPREGPRSPWTPTPGGLSHAVELVAMAAGRFSVGVAAFPDGHASAPSLAADAQVLRAKQDAGAEFAISDMVFRAQDHFAMVDRAAAAGADLPIVPGIMPILNLGQVSRMAELSGREIPAEVLARITPYADDPAALRAEGIAMAAEMCDELLAQGAPGLHFFTLNRSKATRDIFAALQIAV